MSALKKARGCSKTNLVWNGVLANLEGTMFWQNRYTRREEGVIVIFEMVGYFTNCPWNSLLAARTRSIFLDVLLVERLSKCGSLSTDSRLSLKRRNQTFYLSFAHWISLDSFLDHWKFYFFVVVFIYFGDYLFWNEIYFMWHKAEGELRKSWSTLDYPTPR